MQDAPCAGSSLLAVILYPIRTSSKGVKLFLMKGTAEQILTPAWRPIVTLITLPLALWPYEVLTVQCMILCNGKGTK